MVNATTQTQLRQQTRQQQLQQATQQRTQQRIQKQVEAQQLAQAQQEQAQREAPKLTAFQKLPGNVREQVKRILAGRPPEPGKESLNRAIEFINANPSLRRAVEGGLPTGLTAERAEAFKQQAQQLAGLTTVQRAKVAELGRIPTVEVPTFTQAELRAEQQADILRAKAIEERLKAPIIAPLIPTKEDENILIAGLKGIKSKVGTLFERKKEITSGDLNRIVKELSGGESKVNFQGQEFFLSEQGNLISRTPLPFNLQEVVDLINDPTTKEAKAITSGEKFSLFAPQFFAGAKLSDIAEERLRGKSETLDSLFEAKSPDFLTSLTASIPLALFLEPVFQVGAVKTTTKAKQAQAKQVKKGKKTKKVNIEEAVQVLNFKKEGNIVKSKTFADKVDDTAKLIENALKSTDKITRDKDLVRVREILKIAHGEKQADRILRESLAQNFGVNVRGGAFIKIPKQKVTEEAIDEFAGVVVAKLEGAGAIVGGVSVVNGKISDSTIRIKNELEGIKEELKNEKLQPFQIFSLKQRQEQLTEQLNSGVGLALTSLTSQLQASQTRQNQLSKQLQKSKVTTKQDTRQQQLTRQIQRTKQLQKQIQALKSQTKGAKVKPRIPVRRIGRPSPIPKILFGLKADKIKKASPLRLRKTASGWLPLIKDKGVFKKFSRPFRTKQQAMRFARWAVDNSTSAQLKIKAVPRVKNFSKKLAPPTSPLKFRKERIVRGKRIPLKDFGEIELKSKRIDTKGEIKGLRVAKLIKQRFGKPQKIKTKKIKKLGGSVSLKAPSKPKKKLKF